tara:strand:- start:1029 stop:2171 length:1143 start_codon:yes stop_codon:yes gene_type:complete
MSIVDWSTILDPKEAVNFRLKKKSGHGIYGKQKIFQAVALTPGYTMTTEEARLMQGSFKPRAEDDNEGKAIDRKRFSRVYFKGRILGKNSPHNFLPNPANIEVAEDAEAAAKVIAMHTTFITTKDYNHGKMPKVNDIFTVVLRPGENGEPFNLQIGDVLQASSKPSGRTRRQADKHTSTSAAFLKAYVIPPPPDLAVENLGDECYIGSDLIYPCLTDVPVRLVVFYHGVGYGNQEFMLDKLKEIGIASNTMFLIPNGTSKNYTSVQQTIEELKTANNVTITDMDLGAWSGGSAGFQTAYSVGNFSQTMLADPSPYAWSGGVTYMEYNPNNWGGDGGFLDEVRDYRLDDMAEQIESAGGDANRVEINHDDILVQILKRLAG